MLSIKGSVKTTICILILLFVCVGAGFYLLICTQQEKTNALLMQTMLINTAIAQDLYYDKHGHYTSQWSDVLAHIAGPASIPVKWQPVAQQPSVQEIIFAPRIRYRVELSALEQKELSISAQRIQGGLFQYQLQYRLPQQQVQCIGGNAMKYFCRYIRKQIDQLDIKNLVAVPTPPHPASAVAAK